MGARMQVCPERIAAMIDGSRGWCMGNDKKDASLTALLNELLVAAGEHAAAMHALGVATGAGLKGAYYRARGRAKIASEQLGDATVRLGERLRAEESRGVVPQPPGCDMRDNAKNQDGGWRTADTAPVGMMVETKIDDGDGLRNQRPLMWGGGGLWFGSEDRSSCVYYTPTHWRPI